MRPGDGETPADPTSHDDPLLLYFTSGTVSYPKMVQHAHSYALGHIGTARFWHDLRPGDLHWTVTDTGWAKAAWGGLFGQMHERAAILNVALGRPDPEVIFGILARHRVTSFCAPPTLYRRLVQADFSPYDLSALRHCTSAGEPLNPEVIRAWEEGTRGLDGLRRLRPDRDDVPRRQLPHDGGPPRIDGPSRARLRRHHRRRRRRSGRARRGGERRRALAAGPSDRSVHRLLRRPRRDRRGVLRRRSTSPGTGRRWIRTATSGSRGATTT